MHQAASGETRGAGNEAQRCAHKCSSDESGNPISFGVGSTYVAITPDGSPFSFS